MSQTVTFDETTVSHTVTLPDIAAALTRLANNVEQGIRYGARPPVPDELLHAAGRITAAMSICRPTAPTNQMPVSQLVISLAVPGEELTAKDLWDRLKACGWTITNQAISLALHRAATRGIFERPRRGVYRLVTPKSRSEVAQPRQPTEQPPTLTPAREEGSHVHALVYLEEDPR
jgi:hypothetical protein